MIHVKSMLGLGDAFAARPTIAALARKDEDIWVETPWPEVFSDIKVRGFLRPSNVNIRCAKRNVEESKAYAEWGPGLLHTGRRIQLSYHLCPGCKSIPEQIAESAGVLDEIEWCDFFITDLEWNAIEEKGPRTPFSNLGVFRIPTIRTEYRNEARNPAPGLVAAAVDEIGGDWISLNDLGGGEEIAQDEKHANMGRCFESSGFVRAELGEFSLPTLLDLVSRARVCVTPVSWMAWAAMAYQAPALVIFGGYLPSRQIMGPILDLCDNLTVLEPEPFCSCANPMHECRKGIPIEKVREAALKLKGG